MQGNSPAVRVAVLAGSTATAADKAARVAAAPVVTVAAAAAAVAAEAAGASAAALQAYMYQPSFTKGYTLSDTIHPRGSVPKKTICYLCMLSVRP